MDALSGKSAEFVMRFATIHALGATIDGAEAAPSGIIVKKDENPREIAAYCRQP
jgi:hypothetical protein